MKKPRQVGRGFLVVRLRPVELPMGTEEAEHGQQQPDYDENGAELAARAFQEPGAGGGFEGSEFFDPGRVAAIEGPAIHEVLQGVAEDGQQNAKENHKQEGVVRKRGRDEATTAPPGGVCRSYFVPCLRYAVSNHSGLVSSAVPLSKASR